MRAAQASQRRGDVGVTLDKAAVVVAEADEAAQVGAGSGDRPVPHRRHLPWIDRHPSSRHPVPKKTQLGSSKLALRRFDVELFLAENGQNLPHVLKMLF